MTHGSDAVDLDRRLSFIGLDDANEASTEGPEASYHPEHFRGTGNLLMIASRRCRKRQSSSLIGSTLTRRRAAKPTIGEQ